MKNVLIKNNFILLLITCSICSTNADQVKKISLVERNDEDGETFFILKSKE